MKKIIFSLVLVLSFVAQTSAQNAARSQSPARRAAEAITAEQLKDYLYFVASDEMEGRDTPSRGLNLTAKFIATQLSRWGVKPAGDDNSYFQKIALRGSFADAANATVEVNGQKFAYGSDYVQILGTPNANLKVNLVYGGNGWLIKSKNIDALAGVDVKDKFVVLYGADSPSGFSLTGLPPGVSQKDLNFSQRGADWLDPLNYARQKGAAGIIIVANSDVQNRWTQFRDYYSRGRFAVEQTAENNAQASTQSSSFAVILAAQRMANNLFAGETNNPVATANVAAFELVPTKQFVVNVPVRNETVMTQNVVGMIEGSDPTLKAEIIAVGAHYDHIGISNPGSPNSDRINNGADDDGSGTVAVLAMAEALAKAPRKPKRSVLFVWHAGEEKGLWGSEYFTDHPTVPLDKIVAQLNIDMIGRSKQSGDTKSENAELSGPNEIYVIGSKMMSTELGNLSEAVNNSYLKLAFNYRYDDPKDPNRFFFRSDHFNYARKGVPIIFYFDGVHEDYHRPGDEPQKIDYDKMQRITRTVFMTMWEIGDLKTRPMVDRQLPAELLRRN